MSNLACRIGHLIPIWQPLIGSSFHLCMLMGLHATLPSMHGLNALFSAHSPQFVMVVDVDEFLKLGEPAMLEAGGRLEDYLETALPVRVRLSVRPSVIVSD
jgi:hypothetical protein